MIRIGFILLIASFGFAQQSKEELFNESIRFCKLDDHKNVILNLDKYIVLDSTNFDIYYRRGYSKLMIKEYESSIVDFNKALFLNQNHQGSLYNKAVALKEINKRDEAVDCLNKLIELNPNEFNVYLRRGEIFFDKELFDKALSDFLIADKLNPNYNHTVNLLALTHYFKKNYKEALIGFNKVVEKDELFYKVYENRANVYCALGEYLKAIKDYDKAIELNPSGDVYNNRAYSKYLANDLNGALKDYENAILLNPKNEKYFHDRGMIYNKLGKLNEALEDYTKAISINPKLKEAYINRAVVKYKLKDLDGACKDAKMAKELGFDTSKFYSFVSCK
ncbi:tetratricopeptide repeat protein [Flavobacterium urocaniciphilum]|uniref:Tetratricopeptide repeat-containing protein n=1 Tax=Flavobacterium urocaniciphilum TaxID=1299341 RepID=A0A1H9CVM3_9FLAO|nr:tetratricopeptide repeat protein [Flavobacterium urocaniciphilum]SEQ05235.1 Tetratricopeptide repeat-containing protein [Flavobacterium urocaniciphilum]